MIAVFVPIWVVASLAAIDPEDLWQSKKQPELKNKIQTTKLELDKSLMELKVNMDSAFRIAEENIIFYSMRRIEAERYGNLYFLIFWLKEESDARKRFENLKYIDELLKSSLGKVYPPHKP